MQVALIPAFVLKALSVSVNNKGMEKAIESNRRKNIAVPFIAC
jgi:hypothetical protein